jgi:hypothetical protein
MYYKQVAPFCLMPKQEVECRKIESAFRNATKVFDDSVVELLLYHLEKKYCVRIGPAPCSSVEEIEAALSDVLGGAADILISRMRAFLR